MSNQNLVIANFENSKVQFNTDGYLNATKTAKNFNKDVRDWLYSVETTNYINELVNCGNFPQLTFTKRGRDGGTWIHPKLVITFSRWLSVKFAIWCDEQIENIIKQQNKTPIELLMEAKFKLEHGPVNLMSFEQIPYSKRLAQRRFTWREFQEFFGMKTDNYFLRVIVGIINRQVLGMSAGNFRRQVLGPQRVRMINGERVRLDVVTNNLPVNLTKDFLPKPHQECIQRVMQDLFEYYMARPNWNRADVRIKVKEFILTRKSSIERIIGRPLHILVLECIQQVSTYSETHNVSPYDVIQHNLVQLNYDQLALERDIRQQLSQF